MSWIRCRQLTRLSSKCGNSVDGGTRPGPEERRRMTKAALTLLRQWDRLMERDGMLYRRVHCPKGKEEVLQLLLPVALRSEVLGNCTSNTDIRAESAPPNW